jgi:hypothetical protein
MSLAQALSFSNACLGQVRHNWTREEVRALFALPFPDLMFRAVNAHRQNFDTTEVRFRPCCRSRPAAVRKTAPIARRARNMTPV